MIAVHIWMVVTIIKIYKYYNTISTPFNDQ